MKPSLWDYLREAFNARPIGMFFPPNWAMLGGFGLAAGYFRMPEFLVLGAGVELGYLLLLGTNTRFQRFVAGKLGAAGHAGGRSQVAEAGGVPAGCRSPPLRDARPAVPVGPRAAVPRRHVGSGVQLAERQPRPADLDVPPPARHAAGDPARAARRRRPRPRRSAAGARHGRTRHVHFGAREAARRAEAAPGRPVDRRRSAPQPGGPGRSPRAARRPPRRGRFRSSRSWTRSWPASRSRSS